MEKFLNNKPPLFFNQNTGISIVENNMRDIEKPQDHDLEGLIDSIADDKMPQALKTAITIIAAVEICTALVGNMYVIAMATFFKGRRSLTSPGQGSLIATLVVILAVNDLVMAITNVTMVVTIALNESQWIFGETLCKLRDPFIQALVGVSCSLMVVIAWLRLRCITNSDARRRSMSSAQGGQKNIRQAFLIFIVITMFYLVLSIPAILQRKLNNYILKLPVFNLFKINQTEFRDYTVGAICVIEWEEPALYRLYSIIQFVIPVAFPLIATLILHLQVIRHIKSVAPKISRSRRYLKTTTALLVAILACFAICWLPYETFALIIKLAKANLDPTLQSQLPGWLTDRVLLIFLKMLTMLQASINPILYGFYNREFRSTTTTTLSHQTFSFKDLTSHFQTKLTKGRSSCPETTPVKIERPKVLEGKPRRFKSINDKNGNKTKTISKSVTTQDDLRLSEGAVSILM